jgi:hypothetical protein
MTLGFNLNALEIMSYECFAILFRLNDFFGFFAFNRPQTFILIIDFKWIVKNLHAMHIGGIFLCLGASLSRTSKQTTKWVVFELNNCIPQYGEMLFSQTHPDPFIHASFA